MNEWTLYWRNGARQVLNGDTIHDAFSKAGYGYGALVALDFYSAGDDHDWKWEGKKWVPTPDSNLGKAIAEAKADR